MEPLEQKLTELISEQKTFREKAEAEQKTHGTILTETKTALTALQTQVDAIDAKLAQRHVGEPEGKSLLDTLKENEAVQRLMRDRTGRAVITLSGKHVADLFERKTTITSTAVGVATSGVLQIDRMPGITTEARQALTVRDLLPARPTTMQVIDYVKVNAAMSKASPQVEGSAKFENAVTFTTDSERIRTLATWIPASKQILEDFAELMGFLQSSLPYYVNLEEEEQLLSGDDTGENLNGLITQATAFDTSQLNATAGWNKIDVVGRVIQQITAAKEVQPSWAVMHPNDWWDIRLTKDTHGRYILGDPQTNVAPSLFGLRVVPTTSITDTAFLVGNGNAAAVEIRDRSEMQVEISTEHSDYFTKNLVAIRAEKRLALIVRRAASFITGTFTTSPSS